MSSVFIDRTADVAVYDLILDRPITRTDAVGPSLLANYGPAGELVSVEVLSLSAARRPEVAAALRGLLGELTESVPLPTDTEEAQ